MAPGAVRPIADGSQPETGVAPSPHVVPVALAGSADTLAKVREAEGRAAKAEAERAHMQSELGVLQGTPRDNHMTMMMIVVVEQSINTDHSALYE
jgi:hypothetical protein